MNCELTLNLDEAEWTVTIDGYGAWLDAFIGFTSNGDVTVFDNLAFGYTLARDGETIHEATYPPEGTTYLQTDQPYLVVDRVLGLQPDDELTLTLTASNAGVTYEDTESFTVPRPLQPNPDCVWNDEDKVWDCPKEEVDENEDDDGSAEPV
jgi:hypothetical protein